MQVLMLLAHPDPQSLNHAVAASARDELESLGHTVVFHDLCADAFPPLLPASEIPSHATLGDPLASHCRELARADGIVVVHPNWWGAPPAVLKGYVDRVFRPGVAYRFLEGDSGEGIPEGLLKARAAVVFNTSNTAPDREKLVFGDPLERFWKDCVFALCGVKRFHRRQFCVVVTSTPEERQAWLDEVRSTVADAFPPDTDP